MKRAFSRILSILVCAAVAFPPAEKVSAAGVIDLNATPINNAIGTPDTLTVTNLSAGDIVKVYSSVAAEKALGSAAAKVAKGESKATAVVSVPQFGAGAGTIYVSVTSKGLLESDRKPVSYAAEKQTQITTLAANVVNNAAGTPDTVTVTNLVSGDIVKVYSTNTAEKELGTSAAKASKGETAATAMVSIPQLGASIGTAYITVTRKGFLEGIRIPVNYIAERQTTVSSLSANISNNAAGTPDTVTVTGLTAGDIVNVYLTNTEVKAAGTVAAKAAKGETSATAIVSIAQLGASAGTAYITITKKGLLESVRLPVNYVAERQTTVTSLAANIVNNAVGTPDTATVTGLTAGDIVNVYLTNTDSNAIGTAAAKAAKGETSATAIVNIQQLGASAGTAYITITKKGLLESVRIPVNYIAERQTSVTTLAANIVNNAVGIPDTVTVTSLVAGDIVNVYLTNTEVKAAGTAAAKAAKGETSATAIISIQQLGATAGNAYITVTKKGMLESVRVPVSYLAERQTTITTLTANIVNNAEGTADTVSITGLTVGDIINVYLTGTAEKAVGTVVAKAAKGETGASAIVSIPQLGAAAGTAYITITRKGLLESDRTPVSYIAERQTTVTTLLASIVNNAVGTPDIVTVTSLTAGDIVNVYLTNTAEKAVGSAVAKAAKGEAAAAAIVNIPQLGVTAGTAYITVTKKGLLESDRNAVTYIGENQTQITTLTANIANNAVGTPDTVTVASLTAGDIVNVYLTNTDTKAVGTATAKAAKGETSAMAVVSIPQLGASAGTAYITLTKKGLLESIRIPISYIAERQTALSSFSINIVNNAVGMPDTVTVSGLAAGDLVNVYLTSTAEKAAGSAAAKAAKGETTAMAVVSITQLGATDGIAYITVTKKGLLESVRIPVNYIAERQTTITTFTANIVNNAVGTPDEVTVTSLTAGDIVKVYLASTDSKVIATGTAKAAKGEASATATLNVPQLGTAAGIAYVTVTKKGLLESVKIPVGYLAERQTIITTLTAIIANNAVGTPDTVTVSGLTAGDLVNVYLSSTEEKAVASAAAKAAKGETAATAIVSAPQLGASAGTIYVTVTKKGLLESVRVPISYTAEGQTSVTTLTANIVNNAVGTSDTVTITNLKAGDIVKVYLTDTSEKTVGTATAKVAKGESTATAIVNIPQLGAAGGVAFITVTSKGLLESARKLIVYGAETQTQITALSAAVINNAAGTPDIVTITNLAAGDIVKVYSSLSEVKSLGITTAKASKGQSTATAVVSVSQLGAADGTAYITVTRKGLLESIRIPVGYVAERQTTVTMLTANIVNNAVGTPDTVTITGLAAGDIVNVYFSNTDVKALGTAAAKAAKGESTATASVSIPQLGTTAGIVYISITNKGLLESVRIPVTFIAERKSETPIVI
jgi:hypothetical protein